MMRKPPVLLILAIICASGAALSSPLVVDGTAPAPSSWLTMCCMMWLLTIMQRRR